MSDYPTHVYVWSDKQTQFIRTPVERVVCPECGNKFAEHQDADDPDMWWDETIKGEPHIACACGEQFTTVPF